MPSSEYYYDPDPSDFEEPREVTCKHCGAGGLWWFPRRRGSYLLKDEDGNQHNCMRIREPASLDEFTEE